MFCDFYALAGCREKKRAPGCDGGGVRRLIVFPKIILKERKMTLRRSLDVPLLKLFFLYYYCDRVKERCEKKKQKGTEEKERESNKVCNVKKKIQRHDVLSWPLKPRRAFANARKKK